MSQQNMLKSDILKILASDISGGRRGDTQPIIPGIISNKDPGNRETFESAKAPKTFFGGKNQPYYALAQEPNPAANPMKPIVPGIISTKNPSKRKTYKSAEQPNINGGSKDPNCLKAEQEVVKFCAKPKAKRAPSAYNLFVKQYFVDNPSATITSAAAAWKRTKSKPGPRPAIKLTSFGDVPPPPSSPPPKKAAPKKAAAKKQKLKIVPLSELKKPSPKKQKLKIVPSKEEKAAAAKASDTTKPSKASSSLTLEDELLSAALDEEFGGALMSSSNKTNNPRKNTAWLTHVAEFRKANPSIKSKDVFREAKKNYKKNSTSDKKSPKKSGGAHCGGELELIQEASSAQPIHEADTHTVPVIDIHQIDVEKEDKAPPPMKKDAPMVQKIMVEKTAGQVPAAPKEDPKKTEDEQNTIMVDIMNSYDEFNKRFEEISNSNASVATKRSQYEHERDRIGKYHESALNYGNVLSADKMKLEERAFRYALETFKIGLQNLADGKPQQRVDFENFDDNATITEIIDKALEFPRGPLDRAKSFYSVPIKDSPIQSFNPVIPALGKMASIYPYGRQMAQKQLSGGKVAKSPKQIIKELTRDMFIRDMMRIYPNKSKKQIINAYDKNKNDIRSIVTDAIVDMIGIRGGADCGVNQYKSGDRCYNKQVRMKDFKSDKFFADQKKEALSRERKDDGNVERPQANPISTPTRDMIDTRVANPLPDPKPQTKREDDFVEKFVKAVSPRESGPFFGTDGTDITDPKHWLDTLGNIFIGTADGVGTIFSALADLF